MADKNMKAKINVEFEEAASRQQLNSGEDITTLFGKLRKFLTDLKAVAFSGAYGDLSGTPDLTQYASKAKYGDTTIDVGRKSGTTVGYCSTAEGGDTTASGSYSHAEGYNTTASGIYSHAEGYNTTASGSYSHAGGQDSIASSMFAFAHGRHAKTTHENEVTFGKFNKSDKDVLFSIGDGTSDSARHNAFEITTTGGKLYDKDIATTDFINFSDKTVQFKDVSWSQSGGGLYYYVLTDTPVIGKLLNVSIIYWDNLSADDNIHFSVSSSSHQLTMLCNTAKSTGTITLRIAYI